MIEEAQKQLLVFLSTAIGPDGCRFSLMHLPMHIEAMTDSTTRTAAIRIHN